MQLTKTIKKHPELMKTIMYKLHGKSKYRFFFLVYDTSEPTRLVLISFIYYIFFTTNAPRFWNEILNFLKFKYVTFVKLIIDEPI